MTRWLSIVGVGDDGLDGLPAVARSLVDDAEAFMGGDRHLAMLPDDGREKRPWPSPLSQIMDEIETRRGQRLCVLATGDPMFFGIGVTLARRIPFDEMIVVPAPSAFSLTCARLGWPMADIEAVTLHGRPLELLHPHVQPGAKLVALSEDGSTPGKVAALLSARGYGASTITVLEHMGGEAESVSSGIADEWADGTSADFNTIAVECIAGPDAPHLPRVPGLPDNAFEHDGQMTKREVRAMTLAALGPTPGACLWDVGAGCGSVAIEWMRAARGASAVAIERHEDRRAMAAANALALGTPTLRIVAGEAPAALDGLPEPDAIFIGGGISTEGLAEACWAALRPGGRLVANVVTVEGEARVSALREAHGGELIRVAVSRADKVGPYLGWRPMMPVTQWQAVKP